MYARAQGEPDSGNGFVQGCRFTAAAIGNVGQADPIEVVLFEQFALFGGNSATHAVRAWASF